MKKKLDRIQLPDLGLPKSHPARGEPAKELHKPTRRGKGPAVPNLWLLRVLAVLDQWKTSGIGEGQRHRRSDHQHASSV